MAGLNRFYYPIKYDSRSRFLALGIKCIFISYQKSDRESAIKVAEYLQESGIDVYIDVYDQELKNNHQSNNPREVTTAILNGINNSSHMLVMVSPRTMNSTWVPFEVGYGFDKTDLGVLTLKGISNESLPEYLKTSSLIIRGTKSLNEYLSRFTNRTVSLMESSNLIKSHMAGYHPLDNYLDWNA